MKKILSILFVVVLATATSCSGELVEPIQDPLSLSADDGTTFKDGHRVNLNGKRPLIVIMKDGKKLDKKLSDIMPDDIASINVIKNTSATSIYGEAGKDGVVIISIK